MDLTLELARRSVLRFRDEHAELMASHAEAMACCDCEEFMCRGIEAARWLRRADLTMREAECEGIGEYTPDVQQLVLNECRIWLSACQQAFEWAASIVSKTGHTVEYLSKLEAAKLDVESIVADLEADDRVRKFSLSHGELVALARRSVPPDEDPDTEY